MRSVKTLALTFIDVSDLNASRLTRFLNDLSGAVHDMQASWTASAAVNAMPIRTRKDWGADESLMQWWPEYVPWQKAIVHHTVTSNTYTDAAAEIRSIYYFHAESPQVDLHMALFLVIGSVVGAYAGARLLKLIPERILKMLVAAMLVLVGIKEVIAP